MIINTQGSKLYKNEILKHNTDNQKNINSPRDTIELSSQTGSEDLKIYKMGEPVKNESITGNVRIHRNFHSNILDNDRDILVYLPPNYSKDKKYPVLYVHDGQNVFDRNTTFGGVEWGIDEAAERLIKEGKIEDIIIVGIYNNKDRMSEYTPSPDPDHGGGELSKYADFIMKELKPFVDNTYSTLDIERMGMLGSSLGGIATADICCKLYRGLFDRTGIISPSLWWNNKSVIKEVETYPDTKGPSRIWLDMGEDEVKIWFAINKEGMDKLKDLLPPDKVNNLWLLKEEVLQEKNLRPSKDEVKGYLTGNGFSKEQIASVFDNSLWHNDENHNDIPDTLDNTREFGEALLKKDHYQLGKELFYHEEPGAGHNEWSWSKRIDRILEFLYGK